MSGIHNEQLMRHANKKRDEPGFWEATTCVFKVSVDFAKTDAAETRWQLEPRNHGLARFLRSMCFHRTHPAARDCLRAAREKFQLGDRR
jgi:hypothetical protein